MRIIDLSVRSAVDIGSAVDIERGGEIGGEIGARVGEGEGEIDRA